MVVDETGDDVTWKYIQLFVLVPLVAANNKNKTILQEHFLVAKSDIFPHLLHWDEQLLLNFYWNGPVHFPISTAAPDLD